MNINEILDCLNNGKSFELDGIKYNCCASDESKLKLLSNGFISIWYEQAEKSKYGIDLFNEDGTKTADLDFMPKYRFDNSEDLTTTTTEAPKPVASKPLNLVKQRKIASAWRKEYGYQGKGGIVFVFNGKATGWRNKVRNPETEQAGVLAIAEDGKAWIATGGDAYNGAQRWEAIKKADDCITVSA